MAIKTYVSFNKIPQNIVETYNMYPFLDFVRDEAGSSSRQKRKRILYVTLNCNSFSWILCRSYTACYEFYC